MKLISTVWASALIPALIWAREANAGDAQAEPAGKPDHAMAVIEKASLQKKQKTPF